MAGLLGYLASVAFLSALYYSHMWIAVSLMVALRMIATRRIGDDGRPIVLAGTTRRMRKLTRAQCQAVSAVINKFRLKALLIWVSYYLQKLVVVRGRSTSAPP